MDLELRELERRAVNDPVARARYLLARTRAEGFAGFMEDEDYASLRELDELGHADAFDAAFASFLAKAQAKVNEIYAKGTLVNLTPPILEVDRGRRFLKIVKVGGGNTSVYCFVDTKGGTVEKVPTKRGDVLKAAGWSKPAKHARGSIFDSANGADGVTWHGGKYLR